MISKGRRLRCAQPSRVQSKGADTSPQPKQTNKSDLSTGALTCEDDRVRTWDEVNLKCSAPGQCTSSGSCSGHILHCDEKLWRQTSWGAFDLKHCLFFYLCFRPQHSRGYFPKRGYWICYFSELINESSMHFISEKWEVCSSNSAQDTSSPCPRSPSSPVSPGTASLRRWKWRTWHLRGGC